MLALLRLASALAFLAFAITSLARPLAGPARLDRRAIGVGRLDLTRDYLLQLDEAAWAARLAKAGGRKSLPALFATALHAACINEANTKDEHHVIDIAQGQPLVAQFQLFAFCGGKTKKEPNGGLDENGVGPVLDNTATMLALEANAEDLLDATILAKPMSRAKCAAFKTANPKFDVVCG